AAGSGYQPDLRRQHGPKAEAVDSHSMRSADLHEGHGPAATRNESANPLCKPLHQLFLAEFILVVHTTSLCSDLNQCFESVTVRAVSNGNSRGSSPPIQYQSYLPDNLCRPTCNLQ